MRQPTCLDNPLRDAAGLHDVLLGLIFVGRRHIITREFASHRLHPHDNVRTLCFTERYSVCDTILVDMQDDFRLS